MRTVNNMTFGFGASDSGKINLEVNDHEIT